MRTLGLTFQKRLSERRSKEHSLLKILPSNYLPWVQRKLPYDLTLQVPKIFKKSFKVSIRYEVRLSLQLRQNMRCLLSSPSLLTVSFYFYCKLQIMIGNSTLQVEAPRQIKKPALFIRNVRKIGSAKVLAVMNQLNCDRVRINDKSKDVQSDLAVVFFPTEESAFQALHKLKTLRVEGVKIAVSFRLFFFVSVLFLLLSLLSSYVSIYVSFSS